MAVKTKSCCFPHAGGDVSKGLRHNDEGGFVFPTQVGMFPVLPRTLLAS